MLYLQEDLRRVLPQHVHRLVFHVRNTNTSLGNLGLAYKENNLRGYLYTWVGLTLRFVDFKMVLLSLKFLSHRPSASRSPTTSGPCTGRTSCSPSPGSSPFSSGGFHDSVAHKSIKQGEEDSLICGFSSKSLLGLGLSSHLGIRNSQSIQIPTLFGLA